MRPWLPWALLILLTACAGPSHDSRAQQCADGLKTAERELEAAKVNGFSGSVAWTKAAGLISAASVQKEFEKYPNCIDKVRRARAYIRQSQNPSQ
jgi:hypothetical protein